MVPGTPPVQIPQGKGIMGRTANPHMGIETAQFKIVAKGVWHKNPVDFGSLSLGLDD